MTPNSHVVIELLRAQVKTYQNSSSQQHSSGCVCLEYKAEGARPRGRPKKTWREIVEKDCKVRGLNREDAIWIVVDGESR